MSPAAQIAANRRNARASTGPWSAKGKARAARNARRHGSTAAPDPGRVEIWLRIILVTPEITPRDELDGSQRMGPALAPARAEVACVRARAILEAGRASPVPPCTKDDLHAALSGLAANAAPEAAAASLSGLRARIAAGQAQEMHLRLPERHLREAEGARRRTFHDWIAWLGTEGAPGPGAAPARRPLPAGQPVAATSEQMRRTASS